MFYFKRSHLTVLGNKLIHWFEVYNRRSAVCVFVKKLEYLNTSHVLYFLGLLKMFSLHNIACRVVTVLLTTNSHHTI